MKHKVICMCLAIALSLLFYATARAEDVSIRGGPSIVDGKPSGAAKIFGVRVEDDLFYGVRQAIEVGGWADKAEGHKSSLYSKFQLGVSPGMEEGIYGSAFLGVAGISATDRLLGGRLQFSEDIAVGFREVCSFMSVGYSHFSSAGLSSPNKGRDFLTFSAGVRF